MWFLVILNALAKNMIPLIRQKSFLEKTNKGGWARDVTTESWHSHVPPSPPKARAKLFSFNIYMYEVDLLMGGPNLNLT